MITTLPASSSASSLASLPHFNRPTYLMCPPEWYDVDYVINPWMAGNLHQPSRDAAFMQWKSLYQALRQIADVRLLHAQKGSPDMVFVAHSALVLEPEGLLPLLQPMPWPITAKALRSLTSRLATT